MLFGFAPIVDTIIIKLKMTIAYLEGDIVILILVIIIFFIDKNIYLILRCGGTPFRKRLR